MMMMQQQLRALPLLQSSTRPKLCIRQAPHQRRLCLRTRASAEASSNGGIFPAAAVTAAAIVKEETEEDDDAAPPPRPPLFEDDGGSAAGELLLRSAAANGVDAPPALPQLGEDAVSAAISSSSTTTPRSSSSTSSSSIPTTSSSTPSSTSSNETEGMRAMRGIASLAFPLAAQNLGGYSVSIIGQIAIGRLGPAMLGAAVLCNSVYNMTGLSLAMGLAAGLETLAGQAYGAGNYNNLGVLLQRAMLVCATVCAPVACLWLVSGPLLVAAGQEPAIAAEAARYLAACAPCLFLSVASECLRKFLQAQGEVRPAVVAAGASIVAAPFLFHLCVAKAGWGLLGAAAAFTACNVITLGVLVAAAAMRARKLAAGPPERRTWVGWSKQAWTNWPEFLAYGVPAAAHICCEWIAFEAVILMAGMLPDAALALSATGLCLTLHAYLYMLPMAVGSSVNTRVAHALGGGDGGAARAAVRAALALVAAVQAGLVAVLLLGGRHLVSVFCPDAAVVARCSAMLPWLAALVAIDGLNAACSGILRGCGRQKLGAAVNVAGYWILGLPTAAALAFGAGMGERGLWCGLTAGAGFQAVVLLFLLARWDWQREASRVSKLAAAAA